MITAIVNIALGALGLLGRLLQALRPAAPWILAGVAGAVLYHFLPVWGAGARIASLEADVATWSKSSADWQRAAGGWETSFRSAEALRVRERSTAQAAANSLVSQCNARVDEARQSARVIERIVTKEPTMVDGCPVRELVNPASIADALQPSRSSPP